MTALVLLLLAANPTVTIKDLPDGMREVQVEGTMIATPEEMAKVLADVASYPKWMPHVKESWIISSPGEGSRREYIHFNFPYPDGDRDQVTDVDFVSWPGFFGQTWKSAPFKRRRHVTRIEKTSGSWNAVTRDGKTQVRFVSLAERPNAPGFLIDGPTREENIRSWRALEAECLRRR
jgi:hypothetical protein